MFKLSVNLFKVTLCVHNNIFKFEIISYKSVMAINISSFKNIFSCFLAWDEELYIYPDCRKISTFPESLYYEKLMLIKHYTILPIDLNAFANIISNFNEQILSRG